MIVLLISLLVLAASRTTTASETSFVPGADRLVSFSMGYGFEEGYQREPQQWEIEELVCLTNLYVRDRVRRYRDQDDIQSFATNIDWAYNQDSTIPFQLNFTSNTTFIPSGWPVSSLDVYHSFNLTSDDIADFITKHVWNVENNNIFYYTKSLSYTVRINHPVPYGKLDSVPCRETGTPAIDGSAETENPTNTPSNMPSLLPTASPTVALPTEAPTTPNPTFSATLVARPPMPNHPAADPSDALPTASPTASPSDALPTASPTEAPKSDDLPSIPPVVGEDIFPNNSSLQDALSSSTSSDENVSTDDDHKKGGTNVTDTDGFYEDGDVFRGSSTSIPITPLDMQIFYISVDVEFVVSNLEHIYDTKTVNESGLFESFPLFAEEVVRKVTAEITSSAIDQDLRRGLLGLDAIVELRPNSAIIQTITPISCNDELELAQPELTCHLVHGSYILTSNMDNSQAFSYVLETLFEAKTEDAISDGTYQALLHRNFPDSPLNIGLIQLQMQNQQRDDEETQGSRFKLIWVLTFLAALLLAICCTYRLAVLYIIYYRTTSLPELSKETKCAAKLDKTESIWSEEVCDETQNDRTGLEEGRFPLEEGAMDQEKPISDLQSVSSEQLNCQMESIGLEEGRFPLEEGAMEQEKPISDLQSVSSEPLNCQMETTANDKNLSLPAEDCGRCPSPHDETLDIFCDEMEDVEWEDFDCGDVINKEDDVVLVGLSADDDTSTSFSEENLTI